MTESTDLSKCVADTSSPGPLLARLGARLLMAGRLFYPYSPLILAAFFLATPTHAAVTAGPPASVPVTQSGAWLVNAAQYSPPWSMTISGAVSCNAGTGPWPVTDNGGSLTVDGTVAVSGVTGVVDVTPVTPAANDYLPVRLTDGSSFYSATGGGGATPAASFRVLYDRIVPAANKYMATLYNTSATRKVVIKRIYILNHQFAAATGVLLEGEVRRISARTAGTAVTPVAEDLNDTLSAGITADTLSTAVTDSSLLRRYIIANEENLLTTWNMNNAQGLNAYGLVYEAPAGGRGLTLRQNQGISVKNITASTVGSTTVIIEFTDEAI